MDNKEEPIFDDEYQELFKSLDKDGNGFLTPAELKLVMESLGEKLSDEDIDEMIREADLDGDGVISADEFLKIINIS